MEQVKVYLAAEEFTALFRLSESEMRSVPSQVRHIVRSELKRKRLLQPKGDMGEQRVMEAYHA
ncbi:MAG: hypothetical protein IT330_12360 [Anaerolineae bacterium]|nr:hypothetical protein [Anaerolineae bacterium]